MLGSQEDFPASTAPPLLTSPSSQLPTPRMQFPVTLWISVSQALQEARLINWGKSLSKIITPNLLSLFVLSLFSLSENSDNQRLPGAKTHFIERETEPQGCEIPKGMGS